MNEKILPKQKEKDVTGFLFTLENFYLILNAILNP